ncbi:type VI secretion system tip protein TssI/VgrG [uncultured Erythrobacter sp.]|uniref:type VI secretion system Vgr family protein n=1 Tax=uncultured Erythrobacter sp. TaxID=263913 RepID=UPI002604ABB0|nr:type VI secretion system tip protein TssI/VgrG [uncultured Erythrobacter sp.]
MTSEFREAKLTAGLGGEQVEFITMTASESLSEPFRIEVQIAATLGEIDLAPHLGEKIAVTLTEDTDEARVFNGTLVEANHLHEDGDGFFYSLILAPFTHFMDSRRGYAIFQEKSVIDIIKEVFGNAGVSDFELRVSETYEAFEYCVQYGESDFNFLSRLMEQEGLYYFYEHSEQKHTMVICDKAGTHKPGSVETLAFNAAATSGQSYKAGDSLGGHHILESFVERVASTGHEKVSLRDYDFKKPELAVDGKATDSSDHPSDKSEHYEYPGQFIEEARAKRLSKVRLEEFRSLRQTYLGKTSAKGMHAGSTINVKFHPTERLNGEYLVISTQHILQTAAYNASGSETDTDFISFVAIPAKTQFRAERRTEKPRVVGVESAIVTGPSGETIYTDEYGRIKVRFHWDRANTADENSTCWIRVSQTGGLGNVILPRVGHEVIVDFLHGDPDQPVVTGRVFNQEHMPVYDLPANKTRAVWRTLTYGAQKAYTQAESLDTGEPLANEIRFEDKGGDEEIFVHAERDMNVRVRYDTSTHIGHNEVLKVGFNRDRYVKEDEKVKIDGNKEYELKKNEKNTITEGSRDTKINKGDDSLTVDMGNISIKASMGKIKIEAMQEIELKVGNSSVKLTPTNLDAKALMANFKGDAMTEVSAGGILTEKGALIKIN